MPSSQLSATVEDVELDEQALTDLYLPNIDEYP